MAQTTEMKVLSRSMFLASFRKQWKQGEHLTMIGPTGSGKTTLALELITVHPYVAIIGTKQRDDTLEKFAKKHKHYRIINEFKKSTLDDTMIVWPKLKKDASNVGVQAVPIRNSLNTMFFQGGWTVFCDELWYLANRLKQERILESFWSQGRSSGLSLVGCCQRPSWIPRFAFSEPRYLLIGQMEDERDVETVSQGTNVNRKILSEIVNKLERHEFIFYNRNDRSLTKISG